MKFKTLRAMCTARAYRLLVNRVGGKAQEEEISGSTRSGIGRCTSTTSG